MKTSSSAELSLNITSRRLIQLSLKKIQAVEKYEKTHLPLGTLIDNELDQVIRESYTPSREGLTNAE